MPKGGKINVNQIPLHKQFQFVQKVFGGNANLMKQTVDAINELKTHAAAEHYLAPRILNMPNVDRASPATQEFLLLVKARFE
jgi:hypothetical protein